MLPAKMNPDVAFAVWSGERQRRIEHVLDTSLPVVGDEPASLIAAMRYAALDGGKRVRPLLAYAAGEVVGAAPDVVDSAAAAVELMHAYSLVHDDLPCMDDDTMRRGKSTCHVAFGESTALLAGDALQALAFDRARARRVCRCRGACAMLADAAGCAEWPAARRSISLPWSRRSLRASSNDAPDEDRRADPRARSARRRVRAQLRRRARGARCLCARGRLAFPGRSTTSSTSKVSPHRSARRGQGRRARQADVRLAAGLRGAKARAEALRAKRMRRSRPSAARRAGSPSSPTGS
jgi:hypothetical protein